MPGKRYISMPSRCWKRRDRQWIPQAVAKRSPSGKLTLSVPKAVGRFVIHPLMMAFFHRYPQVDVCLRLEDRPLDFIDDGIDLALRITDTPPRPAWQTADANQTRYLRH